VTNGTIRYEGHVFTVKNGNLITVAPQGSGPSKTRKDELARGVGA
jgi:hypothetical protein